MQYCHVGTNILIKTQPSGVSFGYYTCNSKCLFPKIVSVNFIICIYVCLLLASFRNSQVHISVSSRLRRLVKQLKLMYTLTYIIKCVCINNNSDFTQPCITPPKAKPKISFRLHADKNIGSVGRIFVLILHIYNNIKS